MDKKVFVTIDARYNHENNYLFPLPHELIVLYNQDGMCILRGSSGIRI